MLGMMLGMSGESHNSCTLRYASGSFPSGASQAHCQIGDDTSQVLKGFVHAHEQFGSVWISLFNNKPYTSDQTSKQLQEGRGLTLVDHA